MMESSDALRPTTNHTVTQELFRDCFPPFHRRPSFILHSSRTLPPIPVILDSCRCFDSLSLFLAFLISRSRCQSLSFSQGNIRFSSLCLIPVRMAPLHPLVPADILPLVMTWDPRRSRHQLWLIVGLVRAPCSCFVCVLLSCWVFSVFYHCACVALVLFGQPATHR